MVFTDGAVYKGPLGCGACAAVLIPLLGDEEQYTISKAVGNSDVNRGSKNQNSLQFRVLEIKFLNSKLDFTF